MAINRIDRLKSFRIFRDFSWPADLEDFGRFNLVFGWNGSGKSTLTYLFECLERRVQPDEGIVSVVLSGSSVSGNDFQASSETIRVFNRRYIHENIFQVPGSLSPIFVIGAANIEAQHRIELLDEHIKALDGEIEILRKEKQQSLKALNDVDTTAGKAIKDTIWLHASSTNPMFGRLDPPTNGSIKARCGSSSAASRHAIRLANHALLAVFVSSPKTSAYRMSCRLVHRPPPGSPIPRPARSIRFRRCNRTRRRFPIVH